MSLRKPEIFSGHGAVVFFSVREGQPVCGELGGAAAGENRAPTPVLAGDGDVTRRYLLEGIVVAVCIYSLVVLCGKP